MQLAELLACLSGAEPEAIDRAIEGAGTLSQAQRAQLRGYSLAALEPADVYGVALYLRRYRPEGVFSLAEIPLGPASLGWIRAWAKRVKPSTLRQTLANRYFDPSRGCRPCEALALTILWFAAEWGREHADDGEIWTCVAPAFSTECQEELFSQGQPKAALKTALEQCCQRFELRHAFGRDGTQAYYQTVYLQFGLTRRSLRHLSNWMAGSPLPRAVSLLRKECPCFEKLWSELRRIHEGKADAASVQGHSFLPRGWSSELGATSSPLRLRWNRSEIEWQADLLDLFGPVPDGHYELTDEDQLWQLVSVEAGQWEPTGVTLAQPATNAWMLRSLSQDEALSCTLQELPPDDLLLWDENGHLRSRGALPRRDWTVRVRSDWKVQSSVRGWLRQGPWTYYRLLEGPLWLLDQEGSEVALELAESPLRGLQLQLEPKPLQLLPHQIKGALVGLPADCQLQSLHTSAGPAEFHEYVHDYEVNLSVSATADRPAVALRAKAKDARGKIWTRTLWAPLELDLITWSLENEWRTFTDLKLADVAQLQSVNFRFFLKEQELALMEGDQVQGRPPTRTSPLRGLFGLGAPLTLRPGPYNTNGPHRTLVHSLQNQGICHGFAVEDGNYYLKLRRPVHLDQEFSLIWWDGRNQPQWQALASQDGPVSEITGEYPLQGGGLVALSYRGRRLGAIWKHLRLENLSGFDTSRQAFGFLRWLQLPYLEWTWNALLRGILKGHECQALLAWTQEEDFSVAGLALRFKDGIAMQPVARQMLSQVQWTSGEAWELLSAIPYGSLLRIHPRLLVSLLQRAGANKEMQVISRELLSAGGHEALWLRAVQEMGVDRKWLEQCCDRYFDEPKGDPDVRIALSCPAFLELVTVLALE